jgi:nucleoside-diphosphate-sugar epimerase
VSSSTLAITGGTGFVGQSVIRRARTEGFEVRALARSSQAPIKGVTWIEGALDRPDALEELCRGSDAIIHVAGVVNAPNRTDFEAGNVAGTLAMVEAARAAGVERFIHVSSIAAREPDLSLYCATKAKAETIVAASGLDWTMVRPPAVYGPGEKDILDLFRMAKRGFVMLPPGGQMSLIEVSDLARLLIDLIPVSGARSQIYEADDGRDGGWSQREFGKAIGNAIGKSVATISAPPWLMRLAAWGDRLIRRDGAKLTADRVAYLCHPDWVIDPAKRPPPEIWQPAVVTRAGLKATANAYRLAGWL